MRSVVLAIFVAIQLHCATNPVAAETLEELKAENQRLKTVIADLYERISELEARLSGADVAKTEDVSLDGDEDVVAELSDPVVLSDKISRWAEFYENIPIELRPRDDSGWSHVPEHELKDHLTQSFVQREIEIKVAMRNVRINKPFRDEQWEVVITPRPYSMQIFGLNHEFYLASTRKLLLDDMPSSTFESHVGAEQVKMFEELVKRVEQDRKNGEYPLQVTISGTIVDVSQSQSLFALRRKAHTHSEVRTPYASTHEKKVHDYSTTVQIKDCRIVGPGFVLEEVQNGSK